MGRIDRVEVVAIPARRSRPPYSPGRRPSAATAAAAWCRAGDDADAPFADGRSADHASQASMNLAVANRSVASIEVAVDT